MNNQEVKEKYVEIFNYFGFNKVGFEHLNPNKTYHFTPFRFSSINDPYKYRTTLLRAIHFCVENGHYDIMSQDGEVHKKHELFFERLKDDSYAPYERLRSEGFLDEEDFLNWLDDTVKVTVKSYEIREILLKDPNVSLYYEYNPVIYGVKVYIKVAFERHFMCIDIHTDDENVVDAFSK